MVELNDPLTINKFHVKDLELPLFWCNVTGGTISFSTHYSAYTWTWSVLFPAGCYTGSQFAEKLQKLMREAGGTGIADENNPADSFEPSLAGVTVGYVDDNKLRITFPGDALELYVNGPVVYTGASITWPTNLKKYFSIAYLETDLSYETATTNLDSPYPLRLIPNYLYLHSNLMSAAPYIANTRALGAFASRTIVAKIQIDTNYTYQQSIMPWINPCQDSDFMFDLNGTEFNQMEFWFTDEEGIEIDFQNVNFSLTLSIFYSRH